MPINEIITIGNKEKHYAKNNMQKKFKTCNLRKSDACENIVS